MYNICQSWNKEVELLRIKWYYNPCLVQTIGNCYLNIVIVRTFRLNSSFTFVHKKNCKPMRFKCMNFHLFSLSVIIIYCKPVYLLGIICSEWNPSKNTIKAKSIIAFCYYSLSVLIFIVVAICNVYIMYTPLILNYWLLFWSRNFKIVFTETRNI